MKIKTFHTLKRLMQQTTSDNDHEALSALRKANDLLKADGVDWDRVFARTVQVINEFEAAPDDGEWLIDSSKLWRQQSATRIDAAFEVLGRKELRGEAEDFIASLQEQWLTRRSLSEKQQEALFKFARNAEERR